MRSVPQDITGRYPWGIQRLVSIHAFLPCLVGGGILGNSKLKVQSPDQILVFGGVGGGILGDSKLKVPSPDQIFIFGGGGGVSSWPGIGYSWQNEHKIL